MRDRPNMRTAFNSTLYPNSPSLPAPMSEFFMLVAMATLLGLTSFIVGMIPLTLTVSGTLLSCLSALGTGLLLGTGLGVIIPEGIEALSTDGGTLSNSLISLPLLSGFSFMLLVEQFASGSTHTFAHHPQPRTSMDFAFDAELSEAELADGPLSTPRHLSFDAASPGVHPRNRATDEGLAANAVTVGLVVHGLADGFALGISALSGSNSSDLSLLVFLALAIHKVPTALAYAVSLVSASLPRAVCRRHLLAFSASTPLGAILSYALFRLVDGTNIHRAGIALLISAGSFLYVATVLQPATHKTPARSEDISSHMRTLLVTVGIFIPTAMSILLEHNHDHIPSQSGA
ncbi:Zip-domain-containing protein [Auriscalpium vulgare]|uniref:Zip-domain-containing protein n=1 Tax=Auriscalpium vulgare TaxID=40419 RepID=A0ACB8RZB2_9AGAM|nr:Zip-domain-containing protein [Auriscalpium vulgare]